jgi:hypothetical protein
VTPEITAVGANNRFDVFVVKHLCTVTPGWRNEYLFLDIFAAGIDKK